MCVRVRVRVRVGVGVRECVRECGRVRVCLCVSEWTLVALARGPVVATRIKA